MKLGLALGCACVTFAACAVPTKDAPTTDGTALVGLGNVAGTPAEALQRYVDGGEIAGAISMVATSGKVETAYVGLADPTTGRPFDDRSFFWIASMTKGFCGAAVMSCVDKGLLSLDDPIEKYIPEIADVKVEEKDATGRVVRRSPKTKMTIRMCLSHVAGYPFSTPLELERGALSMSLAEHVKGAVECPLLRDPLTKHQYSNVDINLAGRVVEIVTGMAFEDYLQQTFFDPLGMKDITFYPSAEQLSHKVYVARVANGRHYEDGRNDQWAKFLKHKELRRGHEHAIAAGGLYSTAADVMKFYLMLANDGKAPDGRRILSHAAIVELSRAQYPSLDRYTLGLRQFGDWFGHDGALQTEAYANWKENRAALLFVQVTGKWDHRFKKDWRASAMAPQKGPLSANTGKWKMFDRRLGMFIHWGIYSVGGLHEQEQSRYGIPREEYAKRKERFFAEKFDPDHFIDVAESAGAEYIVITTKHHDGFCMWATKTTEFNVMNTPAKRDVIGELAAACKRRGMKLGFYFSNPDWNASFANNAKSTHQIPLQPGDKPDLERYVAFVKAQVAELLSNYGEIVCFFWDIPTNIERPEMDELVRKLQPGIKINDRGWGNALACDYSTPERDYKWDTPSDKNIEACDAAGVHSWGYRINEDYHSLGYMSRRIDRYLAAGGNFLLNVGPKSDGTIPEESVRLMAEVGRWYRRVRESYHDVVTDGTLVEDKKCIVGRRGDVLFLHFPEGLDASGFALPPLAINPVCATVLNNGRKLRTAVEMMPWRLGKDVLHVMDVPVDELANEAVVVRLDFRPGELPAVSTVLK